MSNEPATAPTVVRCLMLRRLQDHKTTSGCRPTSCLVDSLSCSLGVASVRCLGVATRSLKHVKELFPIPLSVVRSRETLLRGCKRGEVEAKVFSFNTLTTVHTFRFGFAKIQTFEISLYRFVPFCTFLYLFVPFCVVLVCNWLGLSYRFADGVAVSCEL